MDVKKIVKKVLVNVAMAIAMIILGIAISTAMYSAGFRFNLPKITIEYENEDHDLILIDRAVLDSQAPATVAKN